MTRLPDGAIPTPAGAGARVSSRTAAPAPRERLTTPVAASRLTAPAPGWTTEADIVVVGSGVAGLTAALEARRAGRVLLVTKADLSDGSTRWAQGGIAAALGEDDTPAAHHRDTLLAGAGLCDAEAVRVLVTEGPDAVARLIGLGAAFDQDPDGTIQLTREGGHRARRIAHAGGDATGAEVTRALLAALDEAVAAGEMEVIEHALVLDLLRDAEGRAAGVSLHVMGEGQRDGVGAVLARAVVLATGGLGQVFAATTNPAVATGDGVALALRAGAEVADLEFVQFHPTVMWLGDAARGQQPLVSEAVRGEGAVLRDADGVRFMVGVHELADLAPRDVVAKAITRRMRETGTDCVHLDGTAFGPDLWATRFPTILASCREHGIDPVTQPIPVSPAAHHASGGVLTDLYGRTTVPGLFACGEVACTGVHGANRLASNSLLEGLVFAHRIAAELERGLPVVGPVVPDSRPAALLDDAVRGGIQQTMTAGVGILRSADSLHAAGAHLDAMAAQQAAQPCVESWEVTNLHLVAQALTAGATLREETRGCHWREDHPDTDSARWGGRVVTTLTGGALVTRYRPAAPADGPDEPPALRFRPVGRRGPAERSG